MFFFFFLGERVKSIKPLAKYRPWKQIDKWGRMIGEVLCHSSDKDLLDAHSPITKQCLMHTVQSQNDVWCTQSNYKIMWTRAFLKSPVCARLDGLLLHLLRLVIEKTSCVITPKGLKMETSLWKSRLDLFLGLRSLETAENAWWECLMGQWPTGVCRAKQQNNKKKQQNNKTMLFFSLRLCRAKTTKQ